MAAALLLLLIKHLVKRAELYEDPKPGHPPPTWIRGLLVLTSTGVSFAHGSNDGQNGMGLILLILIGILPGTYALNLQTDRASLEQIVRSADEAAQVLELRAVAVPAAGDGARVAEGPVAKNPGPRG